MNTANRRTILKNIGSISVGTALAAGSVAAHSDQSTQKERRLEVLHDSVVKDGVKYTTAVCHNKRTDEMDGVILRTGTESEGAGGLSADTNEQIGLSSITDTALANIREEISKNDERVKASNWTESGSEDLWDLLVDSEAQLRAQERSIWDEIIDEISTGVMESIDEIGLYYIESPEGTSCDATYGGGPHRQLGVSIDYADNLNALGSTVIGAAVGGILTAVVSGGYAGIVGGIAGSVAGFAVSHMKDTSNLTTVLRDYDSCTCLWGHCLCNPKLEPLVSGIWMDENEDLLTIPSLDPYGTHLGNFVEGFSFVGSRIILDPTFM